MEVQWDGWDSIDLSKIQLSPQTRLGPPQAKASSDYDGMLASESASEKTAGAESGLLDNCTHMKDALT